MKKMMMAILVLGFFPPVPPARAEHYHPQFSLSLDLLGHSSFAPGGSTSSDFGMGGAFFADWRPMPFLSLGTGMDFTQYLNNGGWRTGSWNLGGRLFPGGTQKEGELYLQGTAGLDFASTVRSLMGKWPGSAHGSFGCGYRVFMGEGNALDLGLQYDLYSPISSPLSSVGLKVGWTLLFGQTPGKDKEASKVQPQPTPDVQAPAVKKAKKKKPTRHAANPKATATATPSGLISYTWVAGDTLESISEAFLGRGNYFPLILDANNLISPQALKAGVVIHIPQNATDAQKDAAQASADDPKYDAWKKVGKPY